MQLSGIGRCKAGGEASQCHQESQALVVTGMPRRPLKQVKGRLISRLTASIKKKGASASPAIRDDLSTNLEKILILKNGPPMTRGHADARS